MATGRRARRPSRGEAGIGLVEALIAMALLLVVAISILPLFTRSMSNNVAGSQSTQIANQARRQLESLYQLPFNNQALEITAGSERLTTDYFSSGDPKVEGDEYWTATAPSGTARTVWTRDTTIRQYSLGGTVTDSDADGVLDFIPGLEDSDDPGDDDYGYFDSPLDAGTDRGFIHIKEVEVLLQYSEGDHTGEGLVGPVPDMRIRVLKPF
ncbi:MAG: hypothetical protein AAF481_05485 [Acidobacteriota bacterium]